MKRKFLSAVFLVVLPFSVFFAYKAFAVESQPVQLPPGFVPSMDMPTPLPILEPTRLGTLGGSWSRPYAINNKGQIIGVSALAGDQFAHGFLWEKGVMKDLGEVVPIAIGNNGKILFSERTNRGGAPAFLENDKIILLGKQGTLGRPQAINRFGYIVGSLEMPPKEQDSDQVSNRAFLFKGNKMMDLGTLGGENSEANDINSRTQIVGNSTIKDGKSRAFLFTKGSMRDLGTLGGDYSSAVAINDKGEIAGVSTTPSGSRHGFLYKNGEMKDIGFFGREGSVEVTDMNNNGEIVGMINDVLEMYKPGVLVMGDSHAFVWKNGVLTDLSAIIRFGDGEKIEGIYGINNSRQVIGVVQTNGSGQQGFVINLP